MDAYSWYSTLVKPSWAPPAWLFGPVWSVLYILIAVSFGTVFYRVYKKKLTRKFVWPLVLNLISNLLFSPIQFGLRNNILAAADVLAVLFTLIWAIKIIYPKIRWAAYLLIPYLLWVSFATVLQLTVAYLNW